MSDESFETGELQEKLMKPSSAPKKLVKNELSPQWTLQLGNFLSTVNGWVKSSPRSRRFRQVL